MNTDLDYIDTDSTFSQKVETDTNICSSCYRKIREFRDPSSTLPGFVSDFVEYERHTGRDYFDDKKESGRSSKGKAFCSCGAVDWDDAKIRPLDMEQMIDAAFRISNRLGEKDIEHNRDVLLNYVESEAPKPENQFREEKVFEEATEEAIEFCREGDK